MRKIWLPYPLYFLKPFIVALIGIILLYVSEDLFTAGFAVLCLGYSGWIIFMRVMWAIKRKAKSRFGKSKKTGEKTYSANFPDR